MKISLFQEILQRKQSTKHLIRFVDNKLIATFYSSNNNKQCVNNKKKCNCNVLQKKKKKSRTGKCAHQCNCKIKMQYA